MKKVIVGMAGFAMLAGSILVAEPAVATPASTTTKSVICMNKKTSKVVTFIGKAKCPTGWTRY